MSQIEDDEALARTLQSQEAQSRLRGSSNEARAAAASSSADADAWEGKRRSRSDSVSHRSEDTSEAEEVQDEASGSSQKKKCRASSGPLSKSTLHHVKDNFPDINEGLCAHEIMPSDKLSDVFSFIANSQSLIAHGSQQLKWAS